MSAAKIGLGVAAGYLLGRTKKFKLAITVGSMLAGQRIATNPQALLKQFGELADKNPELAKIQDRVRGELFDAFRTAAIAAAGQRLDSANRALTSGRGQEQEDEYDEDEYDEGYEDEEEEPEDEYEEEADEEPEEGSLRTSLRTKAPRTRQPRSPRKARGTKPPRMKAGARTKGRDRDVPRGGHARAGRPGGRHRRRSPQPRSPPPRRHRPRRLRQRRPLRRRPRRRSRLRPRRAQRRRRRRRRPRAASAPRPRRRRRSRLRPRSPRRRRHPPRSPPPRRRPPVAGHVPARVRGADHDG